MVRPTDYLSNEEYSSLSNLSSAEKSQLRSKHKNKTDFERLVARSSLLTALNQVFLSSTSWMVLSMAALSDDNGFTPY